MKLVKIKNCDLSYPVGNDIVLAEEYATELIKLFLLNYDLYTDQNIYLWCRGSSGAILAALFASKLSKKVNNTINIQHVKKEGEVSHHSSNYIFDTTLYPVHIIIDDFADTGDTICQIHKQFCRDADLPKDNLILMLSGINSIAFDRVSFTSILPLFKQIYSNGSSISKIQKL